MGKQGNLWDDSALIEAFDHAISKYKVMHGSDGKKTAVDDTEESVPVHGDGNECNELRFDTTEHVQNNSNLLSEVTGGTRDDASLLQTNQHSSFEAEPSGKCEGSSSIGDAPPSNENPALESSSPGKHLISSDPKYQNEATWYSNGSEEYNQLLNKYYEIEGQRQTILQKLNQYSNSNDQNPSTSVPEEYPSSSVTQAYDTVTCYCPYGCQNWVVPCNSLPGSCSGGGCIDKSCNVASKDCENENPVSAEDSDLVQTAMIAAKRALCSVTKEASSNAEILANGGKENGLLTEITKSATDLDVVLNAWYSAGFYTGKYLTEQSLEKKKHGHGL